MLARIFQSYTLMASSSTSSIPMTSFKYNAFLSFRGEDTRTSFVDHLYHALKRENIDTYKDDENLERGKKINKELIQAIEESRVHVVFSKNYASSSWCLDELVKIVECQNTKTGHTIYPIFYDVEPTQVRKQSGEFGKAFSKHENDDNAAKWRKALVEATSYSGKDLTVDKYEVEFIKKVVKEISSKLPSISVDENLVGMRTRINSVLSSLNAVSDEFCMIGIWGIGGGGKTTLARAVFDQISFQFEGKSFVANVREASKPDFSGLNKLQEQVLRDVSNDQGITINNVFDGKNMMTKKMPGRKVLLVLDDVDHIEQLKALAGYPNWFKPGSKIIIATRDKQILLAHKVKSIHNVDLLTKEEAICLLSRCAFGTDNPSPGYEELSKKVVHYAAGLPLTITVLGSTLYGETEHVWKDTLKELEKIPLDGTLQRLELSYKGLDSNCQEIFLDVACILKGRKKDKAIKVLESRGFYAIRGLSVLEKRSLMTISKYGYLEMHDRIQEMGMYIVRRLHPDEPNKHSRLWIEMKDVSANNLDTEETKCIDLFASSEMNQEVVMKGLEKMEKLKLLRVYIPGVYSNWKLDEVYNYFPNSLLYLEWLCYPYCSLPQTFQARHLVGLEMSESRIEQLWEGGQRKVLDKLQFLNLRGSRLRSFDLGLTPNLELRSLNLGLIPNIETLNLELNDGLVKLEMPRECPQLKSLNLCCPNLRYFNHGPTPNIKALKLEEHDYLVEVDMSLECPLLESLVLFIPKLRVLDLGSTPYLKTLDLEGCFGLVELRVHIERCKLKTLCLPCQHLRTFDLGLTQNVKSLTLDENDDLVERFIPSRCPQLEYLKLIESKLSTFELTPNLKTLILKDCDLVEFHVLDGDVKLEYLDIRRCSKLKILDLGQTPNLQSLCLEECSSLVKLHAPVGGVKLLINLKGHLGTESFNMHTLQWDSSLPGFEFECSYKEDLPSSIGNVEKLISEGFFCACTDLESFFGRICGLQRLTKLKLEGNISELPKDIDRLQCLEDLTMWSTKIKRLPDSICRLKHLRSLELIFCELLEKLPEDLGRLECLVTLRLRGCIVLRDIPISIGRMKSLRSFSLYGCNRVEELPEELGHLECLGYLDIRDTCINNLPQSILLLEEQELRTAKSKCVVLFHQSEAQFKQKQNDTFERLILKIDFKAGVPKLFGHCQIVFVKLKSPKKVIHEELSKQALHFSTSLNRRIIHSSHAVMNLMFNLRVSLIIISASQLITNPSVMKKKRISSEKQKVQNGPKTGSFNRTLMASSSTSSYIPKTNFKYDIFLSFRGEDTRKTFVGHLYDALKRQGIVTYKDDVDLDKGKAISKELIQAIEDSRFHVIVFSKDYASSSWCLQELTKIMECQNTTTEQTVYPIFYHVEPTEVRKQIGEFGKAFAKHEKAETAQKWRDALEQAASFSGWDLETIANGHEAEFIKLVVKEISLKLPSMINVDENLVGMKTRISQVVSHLNTSDNMIGITGLGGSGKTTLARAVFDQICNEFEGSSFVENVRECSNSLLLGMKSLQQQVLRDVLNRQDITVNGVLDGKKMMKEYMPGRKALIVLDDVDHIEQLKALAGEPNWFKPGSKIIITTRDKQVLLVHKVNRIQEVNLLTKEEAICLFSRCAFQAESPNPGYEELSEKVVDLAAGLPLTITVLGSFLRDTDKHVWIDTLKELQKIPLYEVQKKLELSYMDLDAECKEIFLDVACIMKGWKIDEAAIALESYEFDALCGLKVLEKRSLITISTYGYLSMDAHIQEMGRYIVRRLHPDEPNKHSRLWIQEEIHDILAQDLGTEATTCIYLKKSELDQETIMKGLGNMRRLRVLVVEGDHSNSDWEFDEVSQYFPNSLQYLSWGNYPFFCFPKTFQANNLGALLMHQSRILQLWEGGERKDLKKLRYLDLNSSMLRTLDLGRSLNLEKLNLARCHDLVELQMPSNGYQLTTLNLSHSKLRTLDLGRTPNLQSLNLGNCNELVELHVPVGGLKSLEILWLSCCFGFTKFSFKKESRSLDLRYREVGFLNELHLSAEFHIDICPLHSDKNLLRFQFTCFFEKLEYSSIVNLKSSFCACRNLKSLSRRICGLQCVKKLTLSGSIQESPKDLGRLECLEELKLSLTNITHLPYSICMLKHLKILRVEDCELLEKLPEDLDGLECLEVLCLWRCKNLRDIPESTRKMKRLKRLDLNGCTQIEKLPEELGCIACLQELYIEDTGISDLPMSIVLLEGLRIKGSELLHQSCAATFDAEDSSYNTFYHKGTRSRSLLHDPDF
ncbi:hypothetical protein OSB04_015445 [Centaurea solstitialis]|uniref:TIR domain-containing protein n=1 Tax=Centaurea solstitialis TaxID=347529 RepID=A0AA38SZ21_9ASTR|nr:hypothetical protein OSB04_015445 [Centaurea solstitialis]